MRFSTSDYGPAVAALLDSAPCNELGAGTPDVNMRAALAGLSLEAVVAPHTMRSRDMARAALAVLWLRYDFLDESHDISQTIETATGGYWHGIMHRREPDGGNAKYWFRRVGRHPVFEPLAIDARGLVAAEGSPDAAGYLLDEADWDPLRFVDLCEQARDGEACVRRLCMQIQQREWELLFDYCYRQAVGR
jgi:hypothetical protein